MRPTPGPFCSLLPFGTPRLLTFLLGIAITLMGFAQKLNVPAMDYSYPKEYTIGGITVSGCVTRDPNAVKLFSGLKVGDKVTIPGERIAKAIKAISAQKLFSDVRVELAEIRGNTVFLNIIVQENPQLASYGFAGTVSRSEGDKLRDLIDMKRGQQMSDAVIASTKQAVRRYFVDKGYLKAMARIQEVQDTTLENSVRVQVLVTKGPKVHIQSINFTGNTVLTDARLRRAMKKTKQKRWYNIFGSSKFKSSDFQDDKQKVIDLYNDEGYRNASIVKDTMRYVSDDEIALDIKLDEGNPFYFRNITFTGNTKYSTDTLSKILGIKPGDIYNKKKLEDRLYMNPSGVDISSLYMDRGYLSFSPEPIERVDGDSIDLEVRMREGKQYRVRTVNIHGNTKTFDHVIRRELRTRPGDLFDRSEVIRSQQQLVSLGFFDPAQLGVTPTPDPRTGMVDLDYTVAEKPSDRLELSGGYGAGNVLLSLGLSFTNFSARKMFSKNAWTPLPAGDGQTLSLRAQTSGKLYQSYSLSFIEPWLGGRKPNSLSVSAYYTRQTNGYANSDVHFGQLGIIGTAVGLGKRLKWPDDYFFMNLTASYQQYNLQNWNNLGFAFGNGISNEYALQLRFARRSIAEPFWITQGSEVGVTVKATPPYSLFNPGVDYKEKPAAEQFNLVEFYKWKFTSEWFTKLTNSKSKHDLVLMGRVGFGFLGRYDDRTNYSPFERFYLGGSGLTGFQLDGREIIALRGYDDGSLSPSSGSFIVNKYTAELRFPVSLNPQATIFALGFAEAANAWNSFDRYDPFKLYRSAGIGLRLFLPMFGPMGLDYGWRFDDVPDHPNMAKGQFHFTIGIDLGEL